MIAETLHIEEGKEELIRFWDQFMRKDKKKIGVVESLRAFFFSSCEFTVASICTDVSFWLSVIDPGCYCL